MSMSFGGVKKLENDESEDVPYSREEDDRLAKVHKKVQGCF